VIEYKYSDFDFTKLWNSMNAKQESERFSEKQMMDDLNVVNNNRVPFSLATVKNMMRRNDGTCQHTLHILRWLDRTPESFLVGERIEESMPFSAEGRLYWNMQALAAAVAEGKEQRGATWKLLAQELNCSPSQVSGLHKVRYGISIHLAMRITQWLLRPSTDFIVVI
jgi:hypothetical protein